jgi:hypothetical protein
MHSPGWWGGGTKPWLNIGSSSSSALSLLHFDSEENGKIAKIAF